MDPKEFDSENAKETFRKHIDSYIYNYPFDLALFPEDKIFIKDLVKSLYFKPGVWAKIEQLRRKDIEQKVNGVDYPVNYNNMIGTCVLSALVARDKRLSDKIIYGTSRGGGTHDIGKTGISDLVVHKEGTYTPQERLAMQMHSLLTLKMLEEEGEDDYITKECGYGHHIWIKPPKDPLAKIKSYPDVSEDFVLSVPARIVCIADTIDSIVKGRPHRKSNEYRVGSVSRAKSEIYRESRIWEQNPDGIHFDPDLVPYFMKYLNRIPTDDGNHQ